MIVKMVGGLGNQAFIYAFAMALHNEGCEVIIDTSFYDNMQNGGGGQ